MGRPKKFAKGEKTTKKLSIKYDTNSGILLGGISGDELDYFVNIGLASEVRLGGEMLYLLSPYCSMFTIEPNNTLFKMFEKVIYCNNSICAKYTEYDEMHKDCNECTHRVPSTVQELYEPSYKLLNDNYEVMIFPTNEEEQVEETLTYWKYLATPYWKKFRKEVLLHYGEKCNWCGAEGEGVRFHVHHKRYGTWFDEEIENVIPLCSSCHSKAHGKG